MEKIKNELERLEDERKVVVIRIQEMKEEIAKKINNSVEMETDNFIDSIESDLRWLKEKQQGLKKLDIQIATLTKILF